MARRNKYKNMQNIMNSAAMTENTNKIINKNDNSEDIIVEVELKNIFDNPYQPRLDINKVSLKELADSIETNGLLQPVILNRSNNDRYEVIAGHRRVAAYRLLKKDKIKAIIKLECNSFEEEYKNKMPTFALIENMQRSDLDILEIAMSLHNLIKNKIYNTKADLAKAIGKSESYITKVLSILKLEDIILHDLAMNKSIKDIEALYELQKIKNTEIQIEFYNKLVKKEITRNDIRQYNINEKNKQYNIDEKPYIIKITKKNLNLRTDISKLSHEDKSELEQELETIIKKYL